MIVGRIINFLFRYNVLEGRVVDPVEAGERIHAEQLRRQLGTCPACELDFSGHKYASFAITVLGEDRKERALAFFKTLEERRWQDAIRFQEFEGLRDAAKATALRCPGRRVVLLIERDPHELYDSGSILSCELLDLKSGEDLEATIEAGKWKAFLPGESA